MRESPFYQLLEQQIYERGLEQGIEQGLEQGITKGRDEVYRAWYADWERRRQEAAEKGVPFNEPPPSKPKNNTEQ